MTDPRTPMDPIATPIAEALIEAAFHYPLDYIAVFHQLLDGGLTGLSAAEQLVYLHLVRETLAKNRDHVRISVRRLQDKTGLSKDTVSLALRHLASPAVDLINVVSSGAPQAPARYQVRWYRYQRPFQTGTPKRVRVRVRHEQFSIESRLHELTVEDRDFLEKSYTSLQLHERRRIEDLVRAKMADLGIVSVNPRTFQQLVLFEVLRQTMYHRIKRNEVYHKLSPPLL